MSSRDRTQSFVRGGCEHLSSGPDNVRTWAHSVCAMGWSLGCSMLDMFKPFHLFLRLRRCAMSPLACSAGDTTVAFAGVCCAQRRARAPSLSAISVWAVYKSSWLRAPTNLSLVMALRIAMFPARLPWLTHSTSVHRAHRQGPQADGAQRERRERGQRTEPRLRGPRLQTVQPPHEEVWDTLSHQF